MKPERKTIYKVMLYVFLAFFLSIFFLSRCHSTSITSSPEINYQEYPNTDSQKGNTVLNNVPHSGSKTLSLLKAPESPTTTEEFITYLQGKENTSISSNEDNENVHEILSQLPSLPEYADKEILDSYWNTILYLSSQDYPDPSHLLDEWGKATFENIELEDPRYLIKENINIEIILDSSGSMAGKIDGKTKMELAKEAIKEFVSSLPEGVNIGLRVYGHKGSNQKKDKEESCNSNELVYDLQPYNKEKLNDALDKFQPTGYSPIACSLEESMKDLLEYSGDKNTNIIYLVSDGIETCDGDPILAAENLANSNITPIVHVLGLDIGNKEQQQLIEIAKAAKGVYENVKNQEELNKEFEKAKEIAEQWKEHAKGELKDLDIKRSMLIANFTKEWHDTYFDETLLISDSRGYLHWKGKINTNQDNYLLMKQREYEEIVMEAFDEIEHYFKTLQKENYEELKEIIDNKYQ